jgi:hypothetical protein
MTKAVKFYVTREPFPVGEKPTKEQITKHNLLGVVAIGRRITCWSGAAVSLWASFDTDPEQVDMGLLMEHLVEVRPTEFPDSYLCLLPSRQGRRRRL